MLPSSQAIVAGNEFNYVNTSESVTLSLVLRALSRDGKIAVASSVTVFNCYGFSFVLRCWFSMCIFFFTRKGKRSQFLRLFFLLFKGHSRSLILMRLSLIVN